MQNFVAIEKKMISNQKKKICCPKLLNARYMAGLIAQVFKKGFNL